MGKRKRGKSDDQIISKIKRLEKKLKRSRRSSSSSTSSSWNADREYGYYDQDEPEYEVYASGASDGEFATGYERPVERTDSHEYAQRAPTPEELTSDEPRREPQVNEQPKSIVNKVVPSPPSVQSNKDAVPIEILSILGVAKKSEEAYGKKIPLEVSERWGKILAEGLEKEQKETLLAKTLVPENFQLAQAPKLNVEVASVLTEPAKNRDKRLEKMQNQLGSSIAGLASLTSELISGEVEKIDLIKKLSEINQILLDLHYEETINRRKLIIPMLDKSFTNIIHGVKRDKYLFGEKLDENIKTSKSIEKSGLQIKKVVPQQASSSWKNTSQQGNVRAPPRQAGGVSRAPPARPTRYYPRPPLRGTARRAPAPPPRRPPLPPRTPPPSRPQDRRARQ